MFQYLDMSPDSINMYVTIEVCSDITCSESSSIDGSPFGIDPPVGAPIYTAWKSFEASFMRVNFTCEWTPHDQARFVLLYSTANESKSTSCNSISLGSWNHIAAVVESINSSTISSSLYLNGTLLTGPIYSAAPAAHDFVFAGSAGVAIGRYFPMGEPFGHLKGDVDEIAVWNRTLLHQDLIREMESGCRDSPGSLLCFRLEQGSVTANRTLEGAASVEPSNAVAVNGSKFLPWCVSRDDNGKLVVSDQGSLCVPYEESWGFCTDKPLLPGVRFDYDVEELSNVSTSSWINQPGCANAPLIFNGNIAGRFVP